MTENLQNISLAGGAAGAVVLPQAIVSNFPNIFAAAAPYTAGTLPCCTGVCGSCGGTCIASAGALLWLACCTYLRKRGHTQ